MSSATAVATPSWDLTDLFANLEDPKIDQTWAWAMQEADRFEQAYRGKINTPDLDPQILAQALKEYESLAQTIAKPLTYASLTFAGDTSNPAHGAFLQKQQEKGTELSVKLMFFDLELQAAPEAAIQHALKHEGLKNYRHYITTSRAYSPHRLSEPEEIILEETSNTGDRAWERLFDEVTSNHVFHLTRPNGEKEDLSLQEVLNLLREPDRELRQAAADSFTAGLLEMQRVLTLTFNNLIQDKSLKDRLRKHPYAEHSRHLANELDKETVDLVVSLCRNHYNLVERFYTTKREILGLSELTHIDRYAPLFETEEQVPWDKAREIVLDSFGGFSTDLRDRADEFFQKGWIDAAQRKGKTGGAFCSYVTPDLHPYILQTYLDKMDDVMTLAHELGHGVHSSLSRAQSYFNYHGTLPMAELASTFGEMLVFEKVVAQASLKDKLALYADKIEGTFATVFRQAAMFRFEQRIHEARRTQGELTSEQFGDIWQEELQAMFGNSVKLGEQHRNWWAYISHFVSVPFYVYAYSFGEMLSISVYQKAKDEGPSFEPKYLNLLQLGGSLSPQELMATIGVDLKDEAFWLGGFRTLEKMITEFESLWTEYKS
jgi:oligoendopeptidase F